MKDRFIHIEWERPHSAAQAKKTKFISVLNWGNHRGLLPEVSGARWSSRYDKIKAVYGSAVSIRMRLFEAIVEANHRALAGDATAGLRPSEFTVALALRIPPV